ncbi:hypothetical protein [Helicobacter sp. 13S00477-4]|uniref:RCC1 domain-containing protein n=1 Tax=Helicobacter sp. 13S00477-4 TaxID=1905759 RepID=UPI000BA70DF7|nr:hypothetical protein [Helicobacter sp. 13S00477-4]PAF51276.1 hypothetical protein BKH44_06105 [Helicobacter sp. 13S00477-4]
MNESEILNKLEELKAIKQREIKEDAKVLEVYANTLKGDLNALAQSLKLGIAKKQIRLLKNVNAYRGIMYQEVYIGINDEIILYGDVYISGGVDINTTGSGRTPIAWGFSRLAIPKGIEIKDVVGGHANFYAIEKDSNAMWVWGNNSQGCLGLGHNSVVPIPQKVSFRAKIKQVCSKSYTSSLQFCTILLEDGTVWSCGRNTEGELGIGNTIDSNRFVRINSLANITEIFGGNNVVSGIFALDDKGNLWAWGWNGNGCLGMGKTTNVLSPELHPLKNVSKVYHYTRDTSGWKGSSFFVSNNKFYGCGYNAQSQLSQNDLLDKTSCVEIFNGLNEKDMFIGGAGLSTCLYLNKEGNVWSWGYGDYGFGDRRIGNNLKKNLNLSVKFKSIASQAYGYPAFYAQDFNDGLWSFGYNNNALGLGHNNNVRDWSKLITPNNIIDYFPVSWYEAERVLIATDGERLYACGTSYNGNLNYSTNILQPQILPLGEN